LLDGIYFMLGKLFLRKRKTVSRAIDEDGDQFKYCPSCGDEFRAEFEHCATCDQQLLPAAMQHGNTVELRGHGVSLPPGILTPEDNLVGVRQGTLMELKQIRRLLEKHGIASLIAGDGSDCSKGCGASSAFILQVKEADLGRAGSIMSEDFRRSTALDSHAVSNVSSSSEVVLDERAAEIYCPACGFNFVSQEQACPECGLCF